MELEIVPAKKVGENLLSAFYQKAWPARRESLPRLSPWLNRPGYCGNEAPLLLMHRGTVAGHAGRIPFQLRIGDHSYLAAWFFDFAVLPEYQGQGFGKKLAEKWMEFPEVGVTVANDKSMNLFRKLGWKESAHTYLHFFWVRPFHHPKAVSRLPASAVKILNQLAWPFLRPFYRRYASPLSSVKLEPLSPSCLADFTKSSAQNSGDCSPLRDGEYGVWRLLDSPEKADYFLLTLCGENPCRAIVKKRSDKPSARHLDLLWLPADSRPEDLLRLTATLTLWCRQNAFDYLRFYTNDPALSRALRPLFPIVRHPRFGFFAKDETLFRQLEKADWHLELIDSDFEFF